MGRLARLAGNDPDPAPLRTGIEQVHGTGRPFLFDLQTRDLIADLQRYVDRGGSIERAGFEREGDLGEFFATGTQGLYAALARVALGAHDVGSQHTVIRDGRIKPERAGLGFGSYQVDMARLFAQPLQRGDERL